jgi:hypothetical protein
MALRKFYIISPTDLEATKGPGTMTCLNEMTPGHLGSEIVGKKADVAILHEPLIS